MTDHRTITPAEQHATDERLPVVLITAFEALRVAEGHPTIMPTADGGEALVRLPTVREVVDLNERARRALIAQGAAVPDKPITIAQAIRLAAPIGG